MLAEVQTSYVFDNVGLDASFELEENNMGNRHDFEAGSSGQVSDEKEERKDRYYWIDDYG